MHKILLLAPALLLMACGGDAQAPSSGSHPAGQAETQMIKNIDVEAFASLLQEKPNHIVLDVRTPQERAEGAIECDTHIDFYDSDFRDRVKALDHSAPVFVYCAVGGRSGQAMDFMKRDGFKEVYNLDGGIRAWLSRGKTTERCN